MVVFGVVNVTADSFSDGGKFLAAERAIEHGRELFALGATIIDVGGESTRPGAHRVDPEVEAARVRPVIEALAAEGIPVSVDTMRASVAAAAIEAGAVAVNDVSGGRADGEMARLVADAGVGWVLMHWRADAGHHHHPDVPSYGDVVAVVRDELLAQVDVAIAAGVSESAIVLDPGLGFAKNAEHNWKLLSALPEFTGLGFPILVGASRKRFLGSLLADDRGPRPPDGREVATAMISALSFQRGAWGVRVHDVTATRDALLTVDAMGAGDE
ncbi:dihydropteroate synthase [Smaragdicoccus niigatensis]|uniref:dihydropteroate synthase n=1 Tax=Smaragdicoccus niigatensis TaxID=359359 RepID=UPI00058D0855|nr:dihydropteroate synthase [Smaragdicoccus niigatensis]